MVVQYSIQKMVSDGTLSTIALGIQYLQRNDIYVRIAGVETPQSGASSGYTWSFLDNTALKILPVVPNGVEVVVYRRTGVDAMYNVYSQNAQFDEATIDENNQQLLYIAQEYLEQGLPGTGVDTIEYVRDDGSFTYYRMRRTDGSYSEEFTVPSASNSTKVLTREALRRSYAEAGYNLVDGSFEAGGTLVDANDVLLHEASGKAFSGPAGTVAAGTNPASGGFVDVSGKINQVFTSVSELKATNAVVGCLYRTKGYYAAGDGGGAEYVTAPAGAISPDGYGDHLAANGVVLRLVSQPTDLNHGVKIGATFVAADAWNNRNALQAMLRNTRWSYFEFVAKGTYYVLGTVHPLRDNIYINHKQGCAIIGRYNDASIPNSSVSQSGGMFGFVHYTDPDNGNFAVASDIYNITYQLDGSVATEYNVGHAQIHNNNCIGFYRANDSVVKGVGGVNGSDHRGINFDGDAVNCHINIGYAKGAMDEPLVMKASSSTGNLCTVKVGRILACPFTGPNSPIAVRVDGGDVDVDVGSFAWDGVTKPQLVGAFNCGRVRVRADSVNGASQLGRQYETLDMEVEVGTVRNTQYGIARAGLATGRMRSSIIKGVKSVDSVFTAAYRADSNQDTFANLEISGNNFSGASASFAYYSNKLTPGLPARLSVHDNISPTGMSVVELNAYRGGITGNLVTPGVTSAAIDYKSPDWLYSFMTVYITSGGNIYGVEIDIKTRGFTSSPVLYYAGPATLTSTRSGSVLTLTVTTGTLTIVTMHN